MVGNIVGKVVIATASIASVVIAAVFAKAAKQSENSARDAVREEVESHRDAESVALNNEYEQISKIVKDVHHREEIKFNDKRKAYMKSIGYSDAVRKLNEDATRKVDDYKRATDYEAKKRAELDAEAREIDEWLRDENYDDTVESLKSAIKDVEKKYQETVKVVNNSSIDSESASKVRIAAEEVRAKAVKEGTEKLEALEKRKKKKIAEIRAVHKAEIDELDRGVKEVSDSCRKEAAASISELNRKLNAEENRILEELHAERSQEEMDACDNLDIYKAKIRENECNETAIVEDRVQEMSSTDKMALYLKEKGVGKVDVAILAIIPLIPLAYCVWFYGSYVLRLMAALS